MRLNDIPEEIRSLFEDTGLMAEAVENKRIELALLGLQYAIEYDWDRPKNANAKFTNDNYHIVELTDQSTDDKRRLS